VSCGLTRGAARITVIREAGTQRAREKKAAKGVDLLVFNDILAEGVGIGADENEVTIIGPTGETHVPRSSKAACAAAIVNHIELGIEA